jgi:hypothetical protein
LRFGEAQLLVTFNRALVAYLKHFRDSRFTNVTVENYHLFARGYLNSRGKIGYNTICKPLLRDQLIQEAVAEAAVRSPTQALLVKGAEFFSREIQWIEQHGIGTIDEYRRVERVGRGGLRLDKKSREFVFEVLNDYLSKRQAQHKEFDWDDIATAVCNELDDQLVVAPHISESSTLSFRISASRDLQQYWEARHRADVPISLPGSRLPPISRECERFRCSAV